MKNFSGFLLTLDILPTQLKTETRRQVAGLHLKTGHIKVLDKEKKMSRDDHQSSQRNRQQNCE